MSTKTLSIPAGVLPRVREGVVAVARDVAEGIDHAAGVEGLFLARERLSGVCALLECIDGAQLGESVEVGVREHGVALAAAVEVMLPLMRIWLCELHRDSPSRREREEEYRLLREFAAVLRGAMIEASTVVDGEMVRVLREALYSELGDVAEELASVSRAPARGVENEWSEHVARFDRARVLLDEIGWNERFAELDVELDLAVHQEVIETALQRDLDTHRDLANTDDAYQRERATMNIDVIERLLTMLEQQA